MKEQFSILIELNRQDKNIFKLKQSNRNLPIAIEEILKKINSSEQKFSSISEEKNITENKLSETKEKIEKETSTLEESNNRLNHITTNKEYDAIHTEIIEKKRLIEEMKANFLHYQNALELLTKDEKEAEEEFIKVKEEEDQTLQEYKKELASIEDRVQEIRIKREEIAKNLDKSIFANYEKILARFPLANIVSSINWAHKICANCQRVQPLQKINIASKHKSIQNCETCGSLIIWKEETDTEN